MAKRTKEQRKRLSEAMKKRWKAKKDIQRHNENLSSTAGTSNATSSTNVVNVAMPEPHIRRSNYFNIRVERPDGTVISVTND